MKIRKLFLYRMMKPFLRKVKVVDEEWMQSDKVSRLTGGASRKVDIIELDCEHRFWREKMYTPSDLFMMSGGKDMRVCDCCFEVWCKFKFGLKWGPRIYKWWDTKGREML